ncbi:hypothetical protein A2962_04475 [Candidatus Woesebacteria bacterium RIFCSPLOWO2_01_FULL_39_61]|uniref:Uncharacterized protein n=1 Tax=Candidatus Woesebacteria bacterium RIFCSPHIGHO2_02_FULL_39_13 TaxID=1802505 RepID=A0A1F7Z0X3_9BACT|nr:MAG: hypothetical protein A2692_00930 [Candidatus Woesebacteria bacterium RIFCSPHIGHO2_01_FULL_39_95]OGM33104.1 MAG: hypothetical protein A3D01_05080 [Candidatus Woesebacteria bacterium RIFCSPHIGHO2_02_FULL_39_13]OGM38056.1 MAG: hypothetical protein A3E13_03745 [Candidatus Woesebacteria bacterium RIFCSPHIGHO2_12_FULL_40_20]OGM66578.1 MAG: hypothetical protein A2962_04475 [Candidatus Woesebacteria bacterium RIFCSPLOWO2_01_FULL_39_61]OGM73768.1 MAG: hypothetical protein A3H19_02070 [Candidatus
MLILSNPSLRRWEKKWIKDFQRQKIERQEIKTEIGFLKDDINGIKADLSDAPSRKEFNQLKHEVKTLNI